MRGVGVIDVPDGGRRPRLGQDTQNHRGGSGEGGRRPVVRRIHDERWTVGREEGGWTLLGPERRRRWGEKEASKLINEGECCDRPTRDNCSDAEALKKGGDDDGVMATG